MIEDYLIFLILVILDVLMFDFEIPVLQLTVGFLLAVISFTYMNFPIFPFLNLILALMSIGVMMIAIKKIWK